MSKGERVLWALSLVGCGDSSSAPPSDLPPLEWKGDHVAFGTDLVDEVCLGTLKLLDADVEAIEATLELDPVTDPIPFRVLADISDYCPGWALGCAQQDGIFVSGANFSGVHRHELVHGRLARVRHGVKPFFEEGMAAELGSPAEGCLSSDGCANTDLDQFLAASGSEDLLLTGYFAGADMIHGMLLAEGAPAVLAYTAEIDPGMSPDDVRAKYTEHFGASLDADFEDYARGALDDYTAASVGCWADPASRTEAGGVVLEAAMECDSTHVVNDFAAAQEGDPNRGVVEWTFVIEPEDAGAFVLTGEVGQAADLKVHACLRKQLSGPWFFGGSVNPHDSPDSPFLLGPGMYRIAWTDTLDVGAMLDVVLAPPCTFEAQGCPAGERCTIWNVCEAEVEQPAALGESCDQAIGDPLACVVGSRCVGGVCIAECDATLPCPDGEGCARIRVCGPSCDLLAQDCENGFNCLPSEDLHALQAGQGQCVPAGEQKLFDACDTREGTCRAGLSCERVDAGYAACEASELDGCCLPYCDPALADPGCPSASPNCNPILEGSAGICH